MGGTVSYIQGYVAYGTAIVLNQSIPTEIHIVPDFDFDMNSNFTIEAFFMLENPKMNATLIQLTPTIVMNLTNNILTASVGAGTIIAGTKVISADAWHHLSFVYDATQQMATLFVDGTVETSRSSLKLHVSPSTADSTIVIGSGF